MKLESPVFKNNERMPSEYTCDGENINPHLNISEVPEQAKSLVLIVDDPDAPSGDWAHWIIWNISPATAEITANSAPSGSIQGISSFGKRGYGGPCPPSGTHRYFFKLYALDTELNLTDKADKPMLEQAMKGHILDKAELVGLYSRN